MPQFGQVSGSALMGVGKFFREMAESRKRERVARARSSIVSAENATEAVGKES
jgi:hypothetical protein